MEELFNLYKNVLLAHINTKTTEPFFHQKSEEMYDLMFKVFHLVSEKRQDNEIDSSGDCDEHIQTTYDSLNKAKDILEGMVKEKNSVGMDNLLRSLLDELETACGNARAFINEEKEEEGEGETSSLSADEIKKLLPNKLPRLPNKY